MARAVNSRSGRVKPRTKWGILRSAMARCGILYLLYVLLFACPSAPDRLVCRAGSLAQSAIVEPVHSFVLSTETGARISVAYNAHLAPFYAKHAAPVADGVRRIAAETVAPAIKQATAPACGAFHRAIDPHAEKAAAAYQAYAKPAVDTVRACVDAAVARVVVPAGTIVGQQAVRVFGDYVGPFVRTAAVDYVAPFYAGHIRPTWNSRVRPALAHYSAVVVDYTRSSVLPAVADGSVQAYRESRRVAAKYVVPHVKRATVRVYVLARTHVFPAVRCAYARTLQPYVDKVVPWDKVDVVAEKTAAVGSAVVHLSVGFAREFYYMCYTIVTGDEHPSVLRTAKGEPPRSDTGIIGSLKHPLTVGPSGEGVQVAIRRISGGARQWIQVARSWAGSAASSLKDNLIYPTQSAAVETHTPEVVLVQPAATITVTAAAPAEERTKPKQDSARQAPALDKGAARPAATPEAPVPEPAVSAPEPSELAAEVPEANEIVEEIASIAVDTAVSASIAADTAESTAADAGSTTVADAATTETTIAEPIGAAPEETVPFVVVVSEAVVEVVEVTKQLKDVGTVGHAAPGAPPEAVVVEPSADESANAPAAPSENAVPETTREGPKPAADAAVPIVKSPEVESVIPTPSSSSSSSSSVSDTEKAAEIPGASSASPESTAEAVESTSAATAAVEKRAELPPVVLVPEPPSSDATLLAEEAASVVYEARDAMAGILVGDAEKAQFSELVESALKVTDNVETFPLVVDDIPPIMEEAKRAAEPSVEKRDAQPEEPAAEATRTSVVESIHVPVAETAQTSVAPAEKVADEPAVEVPEALAMTPLFEATLPATVDEDVRKSASNWVKDARKSISKELAEERTRQADASTSLSNAAGAPPSPPPQAKKPAADPVPEPPVEPVAGKKTEPISVSAPDNVADSNRAQEKKRAVVVQPPVEPSKSDALERPSASKSEKALPADGPGAPSAGTTPKPKPKPLPKQPRKVKTKKRVVRKPASPQTPVAH